MYVAIALASDAIYVITTSLLAARFVRGAGGSRLSARISATVYVALGLFAVISGEHSRA